MQNIVQKGVVILIVIATVIPLFFMGCRGATLSGDIRDAKYIATESDLSRLLGNVDFSDIEIIDIQVMGGKVYVFCEGPEDSVQFYAEDDFLSSSFIENVLEGAHLSEDAVLKYVVSEGLYRDRYVDSIREIYWFQLDRDYTSLGNILLVTNLPHPRVRVNVDAIMRDGD